MNQKHLNSCIAEVSHVDSSGFVKRDVARSIELARPTAVFTPSAKELTVRTEDLDSMVELIGHVGAPLAIDGYWMRWL